ncbi:hypothetical protein AB205_0072470 [Aquarana catesbeiana]|uniref:Uncharacterized protein n=1 Tax=Aquarana catesbeiana TaxID=8400 RepID=A0A2G9SDH7_AQUCT|nr:hypothetical protein AB205_0072470 [Aquarana catesbeiana]
MCSVFLFILAEPVQMLRREQNIWSTGILWPDFWNISLVYNFGSSVSCPKTLFDMLNGSLVACSCSLREVQRKP